MKQQLVYDRSLVDLFSGSLRQVFLYVTNKCGLRCVQCFYKTELNNLDMPLDVALFHASNCYDLGARKITLLGGEPSLYDYSNNWSNLLALVNGVQEIGYEHIRLDTNGQFDPSFLHAISDVPISDLSFSLDGNTPEQNDQLRGPGTYASALANIECAVQFFNVSVTICVGRGNIDNLLGGVIELSALGVKNFNFHPLLRIGNSQDLYIQENAIEPSIWLSTYEQLITFRARNKDIALRIPPRYASSVLTEPQRYCSLRSRDRIHIQPNGSIRICPLTVGTPHQTGTRHGDRFTRVAKLSELELNAANRNCALQSLKDEQFTPLCVSFKP